MKNRQLHFDLLKGVAILLVILGHVFSLTTSPYYGKSLIMNILISIHMPIFIVIAGYFSNKKLDLSYKGIIAYWKSKCIRLLLPLFFLPILFHWMREGFSFPYRIYVLEYWFTPALFVLFGILYFFRVLASIVMRGRKENLILLLSVVVMYVTMNYLVDKQWIGTFYPTHIQWLYPYMVLGYLMGRHNRIEHWIKDERLSALAFAGYIALLWAEYEGSKILGGVPLTLLGLIFCYSTAYKYTENRELTNKDWITKGLIYCGQLSLPIYLTHYFFLINTPWLTPFLNSINNKAQIFGWEFIIASGCTAIILYPTLIVVKLIQGNKFLSLFLYGEEIKNKKSL